MQFRVVTYDAAEPASVPPGMTSAIAGGVLIVLASAFAWGVQPALWFQPTAVGILWGSIFLAGWLVGSVGRGTLRTAAAAGVIACISILAFRNLTDIESPDSLLLAAVLLVAGWGIALWDPVAAPSDGRCGMAVLPEGSRPTATNAAATNDVTAPGDGCCVMARRRSIFRWSIWDIAFVTLIVACICHAVPNLKNSPMLLMSVLAALCGGLLSSWIACRWVWNDQWSLCGLGSLAFLLVIGIALLHFNAPAGLSSMHAIKWWLSGPVNVIAAQGVTVLCVAAVWRYDCAGRNAMESRSMSLPAP